MLVAINLMRGLDKINIPYRFNDYKYIKKHPDEIACIIGKPHLLFERKWNNPIVFGAGIYSHPVEYPNLLQLYPNLKQVLVPGEWMRKMFEPYYGNKVKSWPVGIDTEFWSPQINDHKQFDFLIYDKIRWERDKYEPELLNPLKAILDHKNLTHQSIRYGEYDIANLKAMLKNSKSVIFLCEHETQGLAYQQILSANIPILAWDRGGYWQDPYYFPHKVKYEPVSSVPYWDGRCGDKFESINEFERKLDIFLNNLPGFYPRDFILENLTLEKCARDYFDIIKSASE
jgi:hypothetical protein